MVIRKLIRRRAINILQKASPRREKPGDQGEGHWWERQGFIFRTGFVCVHLQKLGIPEKGSPMWGSKKRVIKTITFGWVLSFPQFYSWDFRDEQLRQNPYLTSKRLRGGQSGLSEARVSFPNHTPFTCFPGTVPSSSWKIKFVKFSGSLSLDNDDSLLFLLGARLPLGKWPSFYCEANRSVRTFLHHVWIWQNKSGLFLSLSWLLPCPHSERGWPGV